MTPFSFSFDFQFTYVNLHIVKHKHVARDRLEAMPKIAEEFI